MLTQLSPSQFPLAQPLFHSLAQHQPMCTAVLAGVYPGKIFVDDPAHPQSALLTTHIGDESSGTWGFLAGNPANDAFNRALNHAIFARQVVPPDSSILMLTCDPEGWGGHLPIVFSPRPPVSVPRYHFVSRKLTYDWRATLPTGFTVEPLTADLLAHPNLALPEDIRDTLQKWHIQRTNKPTNQPLPDFGFLTLDQTGEVPIISSWATVDFVANGMGDLGFFTQPAYRRKSLGTIAAAAAIEHGLNHGLSQVNWTCDAENEGSFHTAGKLGLEKMEDYKMVLLLMEEKRHRKLVEELG
ncbi:MAG: GNAT family N-acetyltransferase [Anaerolineales bacterium]|nr:GNAT family N-acetyltransferase [Anaerolineales bacterium]